MFVFSIVFLCGVTASTQINVTTTASTVEPSTLPGNVTDNFTTRGHDNNTTSVKINPTTSRSSIGNVSTNSGATTIPTAKVSLTPISRTSTAGSVAVSGNVSTNSGATTISPTVKTSLTPTSRTSAVGSSTVTVSPGSSTDVSVTKPTSKLTVSIIPSTTNHASTVSSTSMVSVSSKPITATTLTVPALSTTPSLFTFQSSMVTVSRNLGSTGHMSNTRSTSKPTPQTHSTTSTPSSKRPFTSASGFQRTVVFIKLKTESSQYVFLRGGRSDGAAIPIKHRVKPSIGSQSRYYDWSQGDNYLDWDGQETDQWNFRFGQRPGGSPLMWTTNALGKESVDKHGFGFSPINSIGSHYWMMDVDMDCSTTDHGHWFQVKAYVVNGKNPNYISWTGNNGYWEKNVNQRTCLGTPKAFSDSNNHIAKCGAINVFTFGKASPCQVEKFGNVLVG